MLTKIDYVAPKYPRVMVNPKRHEQLAKEANKLKMSIAELVEKKLKTK